MCSYSSVMKYRLFYSRANTQYLEIEVCMPVVTAEKMELVMPHWRPGRYEAGNFAKNVKGFMVRGSEGEDLEFAKTAINRWEVKLKPGLKELHVTYSYYAAELNAGSTWLDDRQLYVNPVNCLIYCQEFTQQPVQLSIELPESYRVAGGLGEAEISASGDKKTHTYVFADYDVLADSPFIASADLAHRSYQLNGIDFHIWIQGDCKPDWERITGDFFIFSNEILSTMGSYPHPEYHFLVQVLPINFYHGVEHCNSTVIAIGPGHSLMKPHMYNELLGVSCHELFHVWNIKHIRPKDMLPYDFSGPNYSRLGYVYEGITTYYGDLLLYRSGVFGWKEWEETFAEQVQKHFDNGGRFHYSVSESSFDTWLDGYVPGVPDRKVSIYTEGCLLAFMTDILIRVHSGDQSSLDDVMRSLWDDFGKVGKGYTAGDYRRLVEFYAGQPLNHLFEELINGKTSYESLLKFCLTQVGLRLSMETSPRLCERMFGFKVSEGADTLISQIASGSSAEEAGFMLKDRIIAVNQTEIRGNLHEIMAGLGGETVSFMIARGGRVFVLEAKAGERTYFNVMRLEKDRLAGAAERSRFHKWSGSKF